jgi:hypothetical protein
MPIAPPLLACLTDLSSLTNLLRPLGVSPALEPLDSRGLGLPGMEVAIVGRRGAFQWLGVAGRGAAQQARSLAGRFGVEGRTAGVMALDSESGTLGIAVGLERVAAITVDLEKPARADLERLRRLALIEGDDGLRYALRAIEALEGEDAGRRFFLAFRGQLDAMAETVSTRLGQEERRALALVQLTRILFLYFVQARGWLDGRPDFLRRALDDGLARHRQLHRDLFRPLFFGTLNRPIHERGQSRRFGRIPFLNGGLFEPHPLERSWRGDIPNDAWRDAFDRLFERFHFSVQEGEDRQTIAPDMLGRVFEGLMAPEHRRSSGTFYTPVRLVRRMVDSALDAWLSHQPQSAHALRGITILDPAVGSGAFLLGALQRLSELRAGERSPALLRRQILERNLFGVDQSPMAVRLAELRLWLAVISEEPDQAPEQVAPLPNLDGVVRQGDSLLDPAWFLAGLGATAGDQGERVGALRRELITSSGAAKRECQRRLRRAECQALNSCLARARARTSDQVTELLAAARGETLFGERRGLDRPSRIRLRDLRNRLSEIRRLERRVRQEGAVPWFVYASHFGDVIDRGGFDLVIGNPPWIRAEQIPAQTRVQLAKRYRWWRGSGPGFAHQPDLAVAFVERGVELLAPDGTLAFLVPAKLATSNYGRRLRAALAEQHSVECIANLSDDPVAAFEATTYPAALIVTHRPPDPAHTVRLTLEDGEAASVPQARLRGGAPWIITTPALLEVVARMQQDFPLLGERFAPQSGVKTGANAIFLNPPPTIEPALLRRALRGRDLSPFQQRARGTLLFPHDRMGHPLAQLPAGARAHVQAHEAELRLRIDFQDGPFWALFRVKPALAEHRVVWGDIARGLTAVPLVGPGAAEIIPLNSCYLLAAPDRCTALTLSAWLNTTWIRVLARAIADPASHGFARFTARVIAAMPLPPRVTADARLAAIAEAGMRGDPVQEDLDALCAEQLGLTATTRAQLAAAAGHRTGHRGRVAG